MKHKIIRNIMNLLPPSICHKILYYKFFKKKLDLKNPQTMNEKIQWLLVNKYGKKEGFLSDKYLVKEYITSLNIENLLVPKTLKVYKDANQINIDELPEQFVLKCNHGSGNVFICTSKKKFDIEKAKKELRKSLKEDFSKRYFEKQYSYIKPVIIAEEYLNDNVNKNPTDYKFYCADGYVDGLLVCTERDKETRLDHYDLNWNKLNYTFEKFASNKKIEKPSEFEEMIKIASKISKGIPFVRVDLYEINGKIYFGELTFSPAAGLNDVYNEEGQKHLGDLIDLEKYK